MAENQILSLEPPADFTGDVSQRSSYPTIPSMVANDDTIRYRGRHLPPDGVLGSHRARRQSSGRQTTCLVSESKHRAQN
jgi:hypothetical protein